MLAPTFVGGAAEVVITAENSLTIARANQTIEVLAAQLEPLGATDLGTIHIKDSDGRELVCQAVDTDFDPYHQPDLIVFQTDFAPHETKSFTATVGKKQQFSKDQFKVFGRFVRKRFDDFA